MEARIELIQIESREACRQAMRQGIVAGMLCAIAFFAWALLLAGGIGWLAHGLEQSGHPWGWPKITLAAAVLHILLGVGLFLALRLRNQPSFPVTRNEFEKDREWLKTLQTPRA